MQQLPSDCSAGCTAPHEVSQKPPQFTRSRPLQVVMFDTQIWHPNFHVYFPNFRVREKIATWLILPVVIRSSQRLSHACVSINKFILWNCERLIISVIVYLIISYYLDNRSNSRANTCVNTRLLEGWYLLDWNQLASAVFWWFIITLRIAWLLPAMDGLSFCPISFDGWVLASHGFHG